MVFRGEAFGRQLDHEGRALVNVTSALRRRDQRASCSLHHMRTEQEDDPL